MPIYFVNQFYKQHSKLYSSVREEAPHKLILHFMFHYRWYSTPTLAKLCTKRKKMIEGIVRDVDKKIDRNSNY